MDALSTIQFPSPSLLLQPPIKRATSPTPSPPSNAKRKSTVPKGKADKPRADGVIKPKQSKSRNGCITCKNKRLKCDETKPTCQQCHKRKVECGGYKKDYKWRPFEETSFNSKVASTTKARKPPLSPKNDLPLSAQSPTTPETSGAVLNPKGSSYSPPVAQATLFLSSPPKHHCVPSRTTARSSHNPLAGNSSSLSADPGAENDPNLAAVSNVRGSEFDGENSSPMYARHGYLHFQMNDMADVPLTARVPNSNPANAHLEMEHGEVGPDLSDMQFTKDEAEDICDEDVHEVLRDPCSMGSNQLLFTRPAFQPIHLMDGSGFGHASMYLDEPKFSPSSPEMLMLGFDRKTCGILSVRDGPTENPWRTAIFPLVHESPALYHAISSMTAFHSSKLQPRLKVKGMEHMRESIRLLARDINKMRADIALASTLVLAFAESWDVHVTTGIKHLHGAKTFMSRALPLARQAGPNSEFAKRIKFLCNTWVYMDVIARLTSVDVDDMNDFDVVLSPQFESAAAGGEIDPLMGCATTLFPLVGRVANLVRKVRKSSSNSISIIQQANELKVRIESWSPPAFINDPEDETCDVQDSLKTAEAYRWATLLYLHQAVPEIPSRSAGQLAKKALVPLALVPISSRTTIVQIYPLLAAGCEASTVEDRRWVTDRWTAMSQRMLIGNIDRCLEVVKEVWDRRDRYETEHYHSQTSRTYHGEHIMFQPSQVDSRTYDDQAEQLSPTRGLSGLGRLSLSAEDALGPLATPVHNRSGVDFWHSDFIENSSQSLGHPEFSSSRIENCRMTTSNLDIRSFTGWPNSMAYEQTQAGAGNFNSISNTSVSHSKNESIEIREDLMFERTVRGNHHWVGVMQDWNWEVLLG